MNTANLEEHEELRDFLYHVREILELRDRLSALIERLDSSFDKNKDATETVMGELETELYFHLPYHIRELREPFERILKEMYGEDAKILVDQDDE
jgi:hypothetical protein